LKLFCHGLAGLPGWSSVGLAQLVTSDENTFETIKLDLRHVLAVCCVAEPLIILNSLIDVCTIYYDLGYIVYLVIILVIWK